MNSSTQFNVDKSIAFITLNQPEKHNAFDDSIIAELRAHLKTIKNDSSIRIVVLKAAGKHFCAGADLAWMKRMATLNHQQNLDDARNLASLMFELDSLPIPTIVRIQGAAYGGAIGLIACCDIAIGSEDSRFCLSEVKLGLAPATIGPYVLNAIGARQCRKLFLTAESFKAEAAKQMGLLHTVVSADQLDESVNETIKQLLQTGPLASKAAKQLIKIIQTQPDDLAEKTSDLIASLRVSDEGQEGLGAFFDKRKPAWCLNHD